jgi:hypothetical protein
MPNSKTLGNNYEREVAKKLSLWITNNEREDVIWREASSGARATYRKKQGKETIQDGDFIATDLSFDWFTKFFFIDSKCYKEFNPLMINPSNQKSNGIFNQWIKVFNNCPKTKVPLMICHIRNRKTPQFIIFPNHFYFEYVHPHMIYRFGEQLQKYDCVLFLLEDFLANEKAEILIELNKNYCKGE